jgi:hypothetical protein
MEDLQSPKANTQTWVILIRTPSGRTFVIATDYKRPFTKTSVQKSLQVIQAVIPSKWTCEAVELVGLSTVLHTVRGPTAARTPS